MRRCVRVNVIFMGLLLAVSSSAPSQSVQLSVAPTQPPKSPPVVVVGGSIELYAGDDVATEACSMGKPCTTDDATMLNLNGLGTPSSIVASKGWKIEIYNRDRNNHVHSKVLTICSDQKCGGSPSQGNTVYVFNRSGTQFLKKAAGEYHLHDSAHCPGMQENRACDFFVKAKFTITGMKTFKRDCTNDGHCWVGIGSVPKD